MVPAPEAMKSRLGRANSESALGLLARAGTKSPGNCASDLCVDALPKHSQRLGNLMPSKLWDYMASGTPTVETVDLRLPIPLWAEECLALVPSRAQLTMWKFAISA